MNWKFPYYWTKSKIFAVWQWIEYVCTPMNSRMEKEFHLWEETVISKSFPKRSVEFFDKYGPFDIQFRLFWRSARWWRKPKYNTEAAKTIIHWMLQDVFDAIVTNQLNDNNIMRNLFNKSKTWSSGKVRIVGPTTTEKNRAKRRRKKK